MWLVASCLLVAHHEARAAHYIDHQGRAFHGSRMVGEHTASESDVHSRDSAPEHDACGLAVLHQPACVTGVRVSVNVSISVPDAPTRAPAPTLATSRILRIAPKTSPPTITR